MNKTKISITKKLSQPTFIEVCAGCGGMSSGLIEAGFSALLLNEIDKTCCETLKTNHPGVKVDCGSMADLDLTSYHPDLLVGGIPCQSFSLAGKRQGLNDTKGRGQLVFEFGRLIDECTPKAFMIENVKGLTTHDKGETFKTIISFLKTCGGGNYNIYHDVLNAVDYNVPQKRERLIIVGIRTDISKIFQFPKKHPKKLVLRDVLYNVPPSDGFKYPDSKKRIMDMVPPGGCWVDLPEAIQVEYMAGSYGASGGQRGVARRLSMDEPSLTLTTSPMQKQTERCHPLETRPLDVREYARIQTFPDSFVFHGSVASKYRQIGNAVPIQLAKAVGLAVLNTIK